MHIETARTQASRVATAGRSWLVRALAIGLVAAALAACAVVAEVIAFTGEAFIVTSGLTVHLRGYDSTGFVTLGSASIPSAGVTHPAHNIFGVMQHPSKPWLYVTSFVDCSVTTDFCWGNARIDRFILTPSGIEYDRKLFTYDDTAPVANCAQWSSGDQVGYCAPVNGVFSPDGSLLYINDDYDDLVQVFSVDSTGTLKLLWEGESTNLHGIAVHPTEPYLYNGSRTFDVTSVVATSVFAGDTGNSTAFVGGVWGTDLLVTAIGNNSVAVYGLANPAAPSLIDSYSLGGSRANALAFNSGVTRLVSVGHNYVATLSFDGADLALEDEIILVDSPTRVNRGVALVGGASRAVVAWFRQDPENDGGFTIYNIASDGTLTAGATTSFSFPARAAKRVTLP